MAEYEELYDVVDELRAGGERHQSLRDLSGMATQIMAAALARAGAGPQVDERPPAATVAGAAR